MKKRRLFLAITFLILGVCMVQSQVRKPIARPNPTKPLDRNIQLPTSFDEIVRGLRKGNCYELAITNLQTKNRRNPRYIQDARIMIGRGHTVYRNNRVEAIVTLENHLLYPNKKLRSTVIINKDKKGIRISLKNNEFFHVFYTKLQKQQNGSYFAMGTKVFKDESNYFTFAIHRVVCLR